MYACRVASPLVLVCIAYRPTGLVCYQSRAMSRSGISSPDEFHVSLLLLTGSRPVVPVDVRSAKLSINEYDDDGTVV